MSEQLSNTFILRLPVARALLMTEGIVHSGSRPSSVNRFFSIGDVTSGLYASTAGGNCRKRPEHSMATELLAFRLHGYPHLSVGSNLNDVPVPWHDRPVPRVAALYTD